MKIQDVGCMMVDTDDLRKMNNISDKELKELSVYCLLESYEEILEFQGESKAAVDVYILIHKSAWDRPKMIETIDRREKAIRKIAESGGAFPEHLMEEVLDCNNKLIVINSTMPATKETIDAAMDIVCPMLSLQARWAFIQAAKETPREEAHDA